MVKILQRIGKNWWITIRWLLFLIMLVFALAGSSVIPARYLMFALFGFTSETPTVWKILAWLVFVFPLYQSFLLLYGFLLGQFHFFWEKEKRMLSFFKRKSRRTGVDAPAKQN